MFHSELGGQETKEQSLPTETLSPETDKLTKNKQRSRFGSKGEEASRREFLEQKRFYRD